MRHSTNELKSRAQTVRAKKRKKVSCKLVRNSMGAASDVNGVYGAAGTQTSMSWPHTIT
jgi:hypothetical protein